MSVCGDLTAALDYIKSDQYVLAYETLAAIDLETTDPALKGKVFNLKGAVLVRISR